MKCIVDSAEAEEQEGRTLDPTVVTHGHGLLEPRYSTVRLCSARSARRERVTLRSFKTYSGCGRDYHCNVQERGHCEPCRETWEAP